MILEESSWNTGSSEPAAATFRVLRTRPKKRSHGVGSRFSAFSALGAFSFFALGSLASLGGGVQVRNSATICGSAQVSYSAFLDLRKEANCITAGFSAPPAMSRARTRLLNTIHADWGFSVLLVVDIWGACTLLLLLVKEG